MSDITHVTAFGSEHFHNLDLARGGDDLSPSLMELEGESSPQRTGFRAAGDECHLIGAGNGHSESTSR